MSRADPRCDHGGRGTSSRDLRLLRDEYLIRNSEQFHAHPGFVKDGEFHRCGYKFCRWYNMIWMEKIITQP